MTINKYIGLLQEDVLLKFGVPDEVKRGTLNKELFNDQDMLSGKVDKNRTILRFEYSFDSGDKMTVWMVERREKWRVICDLSYPKDVQF